LIHSGDGHSYEFEWSFGIGEFISTALLLLAGVCVLLGLERFLIRKISKRP
jgi:hypothetical protein